MKISSDTKKALGNKFNSVFLKERFKIFLGDLYMYINMIMSILLCFLAILLSAPNLLQLFI